MNIIAFFRIIGAWKFDSFYSIYDGVCIRLYRNKIIIDLFKRLNIRRKNMSGFSTFINLVVAFYIYELRESCQVV